MQPIHHACLDGHHSVVVTLIEEYNVDPMTTDKVNLYVDLRTVYITCVYVRTHIQYM